MAHPLALQLRNLQSLVEIAVDKNSTVVFPAPLMSTIGELSAFLSRETHAAQAASRQAEPSRPPARPRRRRPPEARPPLPAAVGAYDQGMDESALCRRRVAAAGGCRLLAASGTLRRAPRRPAARRVHRDRQTPGTPSSRRRRPAWRAPRDSALSVGSLVSHVPSRGAAHTLDHRRVAVLPGGRRDLPGADPIPRGVVPARDRHGNNRFTLRRACGPRPSCSATWPTGGTPFAVASVDGGDCWWHGARTAPTPQSMLLAEFLPAPRRRAAWTPADRLCWGCPWVASGRCCWPRRARSAGPAGRGGNEPGRLGPVRRRAWTAAFDSARRLRRQRSSSLCGPSWQALPKRIDCGTEDDPCTLGQGLRQRPARSASRAASSPAPTRLPTGGSSCPDIVSFLRPATGLSGFGRGRR